MYILHWGTFYLRVSIFHCHTCNMSRLFFTSVPRGRQKVNHEKIRLYAHWWNVKAMNWYTPRDHLEAEFLSTQVQTEWQWHWQCRTLYSMQYNKMSHDAQINAVRLTWANKQIDKLTIINIELVVEELEAKEEIINWFLRISVNSLLSCR